jgi:hypothetical protein
MKEDLTKFYPLKRIKPVDGMAVTAEVWNDAHQYHQQHNQFHNLLQHGWGIVTGLQVIASDPPDSSIYIQPGVAVDQLGRCIVLQQPVSYEIGNELEGLIYLLISYSETAVDTSQATQPGAPQFIQSGFSITARSTLPNSPVVELARIYRTSRKEPFVDAVLPLAPTPNEIDLTRRRQLRVLREVNLSISYLGSASPSYGQGLFLLANTLNQTTSLQVNVLDEAQLAPGIELNDLICLVGQGPFEFTQGLINGLSNYVKKGQGTLWIESLDAEASASFNNLLQGMSAQLTPLSGRHSLLSTPHLFNTPPQGYDLNTPPEVYVDEGILLSTAQYGQLWQGQNKQGPALREQIRAAVEWGQNLIWYAANRRG